MDTVTEEKMVASHRAFGGAGDFTRDERTPVKEALTTISVYGGQLNPIKATLTRHCGLSNL